MTAELRHIVVTNECDNHTCKNEASGDRSWTRVESRDKVRDTDAEMSSDTRGRETMGDATDYSHIPN